MKISVVIICYNEEDVIEKACQSCLWADELIVIDSGSTDNTKKIVEKYTDKFIYNKWEGYAKQKDFGMKLCTNDWVFFLDADETCCSDLGNILKNLPEEYYNIYNVISIKRKNYIKGEHIYAWDPDWQSRFANKNKCYWPEKVLHEKIESIDKNKEKYYKLTEGFIEHKKYSNTIWNDYFSGDRYDKRFTSYAIELHKKGVRVGWLDMIFRPSFAFFKSYILKGGFRNGLLGLLIAQKSYVSVQLKYAAIWFYQEKKIIINNKIIFIYKKASNYSPFLRGDNICDCLKKKGYDVINLENIEKYEIKNSVILLLKYKLSLDEMEKMKLNNNYLIYDFLDILDFKGKIKKNIDFMLKNSKFLDKIICNSNKSINFISKKYEINSNKLKTIYHHYDPRLENIKLDNNDFSNLIIYYIG